MKIKILISGCAIITCFGFTIKNKQLQSNQNKPPALYINNFTEEVKDGFVVNCRKIKDLGVIAYFNNQFSSYDIVKIEFHRFGEYGNGDTIVASKTFIPGSKEFKKKYAEKESVKLKLLTPEGLYNTSDFEVNTLIFPVNSFVNDVVCSYHDKKHCQFYLIEKGYNKTGEKNNFGEELYDKGTDISAKSIAFKNWEDKTVK